ncbi:MAG: prevent-host-death protein [Gammaproteobacteria bacterium]|jgi:prevent-host-death family protein|nr:prevent-host-death protein [Gammaproteobacteria bacterium]
MKSWQLQEAKAHFSRVIQEAIIHGPQEISLRGKPTAIIISTKEYHKLLEPKSSFVEFMQQSPLRGIKIRLKRDKSLARKIIL